MKCTYTRRLSDEELRAHLERADSLVFSEGAGSWEELEQQVERLGYAGEYVVSRTSREGAAGKSHSTRGQVLDAKGQNERLRAGKGAGKARVVNRPTQDGWCSTRRRTLN